MTLNDLEILIFYHVCRSEHPRIDSPAVQESLQNLLRYDLISYVHHSIYETTSRGKAWLKLILETPLPRMAWVDSNGNFIDCMTLASSAEEYNYG